MSTDLLHIASSGVRAARVALDVTAQNIANAGTQGYVRRSVQLSEMASAGGYNRIGDLSVSGVRVVGMSRAVDTFRQAEVRRTGADSARAGAELGAYQNVESALEQSGLFPAMTGFETALQQLTTDPHTPGQFRPYVVRNLDAWYSALDVKPGDKFYLKPEDRARVW